MIVLKKSHRVSRRSGFLRFKVEGISELQSNFYIPFANNPHNSCCKYNKEDGGAAFVEWWYIALRWVLDDLRNAIGANDGIMDYLRAPSVTVLYAVTKDGISRYILTHEDTITDNERIVGVGGG